MYTYIEINLYTCWSVSALKKLTICSIRPIGILLAGSLESDRSLRITPKHAAKPYSTLVLLQFIKCFIALIESTKKSGGILIPYE